MQETSLLIHQQTGVQIGKAYLKTFLLIPTKMSNTQLSTNTEQLNQKGSGFPDFSKFPGDFNVARKSHAGLTVSSTHRLWARFSARGTMRARTPNKLTSLYLRSLHLVQQL